MATKLTAKEYKMIQWSFDFIQHHIDGTTEDIPDELIKYWSVPQFTNESNYIVDNPQIMVFMFILRLHERPKNNADNFLNTFRFKQLFYNFQVILATTAHCREAGIKVEPFPLFDMNKYILPDLSNKQDLLNMYQSITNCRVMH